MIRRSIHAVAQQRSYNGASTVMKDANVLLKELTDSP